MSEYVKDPSNSKGWKIITHDSKGKREQRKADADGAPLTADGMDEGRESGAEGEGPDAHLRARL